MNAYSSYFLCMDIYGSLEDGSRSNGKELSTTQQRKQNALLISRDHEKPAHMFCLA